MRMANKAIVKLSWDKSTSTDVVSQSLEYQVNGLSFIAELNSGVESWQIEVKANQNFSFKMTTRDSEGMESTSVIYSSSVGDLEGPAPATNLRSEIIEIVPDEEAQPPTPLKATPVKAKAKAVSSRR